MATGEEPAVLLEERTELEPALHGRGGGHDLGGFVVRELLQATEVDDERVRANRPLLPAVAARAHGHLPAPLLGEAYGVDDLGLGLRADHGGRLTVREPAVEDPVDPGSVEAGVGSVL